MLFYNKFILNRNERFIRKNNNKNKNLIIIILANNKLLIIIEFLVYECQWFTLHLLLYIGVTFTSPLEELW